MDAMRSKSRVCTADIIRVFYLMGDTLRDELRKGHIVHIEHIGTFRLAIKYGEVGEYETLNTRKIKEVKIIFTPDKTLKIHPDELTFIRL